MQKTPGALPGARFTLNLEFRVRVTVNLSK
jgi:hypothetical protein